MPFYRPSRDEIRRRVQSDFKFAFQNDAVMYAGTMEYAFCEAVVGISHAAHGRLDQIYRDSFPHLASAPGLVKWAAFYNVFRNKATYASGTVIFYGAGGTAIPKKTVVARADGFEYRTTADGVVDGGSGSVHIPVTARTPGAAGNATSTASVQVQESITGIDSFCEVSGSITGGADAEEVAALRARLLAILAEPPGGGKVGDYVRWAKLVTGVTRAWEFGRVPKIGYVTTLFMCDLEADPFPTPTKVAEVKAMQMLFAPIALPEPIVQEPLEHVLTLEIELTIEDDAVLADVKAAIVVSIQEMLKVRMAPPADIGGGVLYRSWISEAISLTVGEKDHKLNVPAADVALAQWKIPTLDAGAITWI